MKTITCTVSKSTAKAGSADTKDGFHAKARRMRPYAVWMEEGVLCHVTTYVITCQLDSEY